jgi:putative protein-disulfide isomerase
VFRVGKRELKLGGYQDFKPLQAVINTLSGGSIQGRPPAKSPEDILVFLGTYGRAAPVEVTTVFDLTLKEMEETVALLLEKGRIRRIVAGNGYFLEPAAVGQVCDGKTGLCVVSDNASSLKLLRGTDTTRQYQIGTPKAL